MSGARVTTKFSALEPDPDALVTVIGPLLVAAAGTMAKSWLAVRGLQAAALPLNVTLVIFVKLIPSMCTAVPGTPSFGKKLVTTGWSVTVKSLPLVAIPAPVITVILPVAARAGTCA